MITPNDIADRLEKLVAEKFPGETIYRELTPQGFTRPSTLIVQEPWQADAGYGTGLIALHPVYTLTTFVEVNEYHDSNLAALHQRQMVLLGLFLPGFIRVGDRAPKVERLALAGGYDYDTVTVTLVYMLDRTDFEEIEQLPAMEQLHLRTEVRDHG